jgi:serine/threonine-protein kinase HipA
MQNVSVRIQTTSLRFAPNESRFVLKPPSDVYGALPENEHLTMQLARLYGIETPPNGLVQMSDGGYAYAVKRFDRPKEGGRRRQEDFCHLAGKSPLDKYAGSAELLYRTIARFSAEPGVDALRLFELLSFAWWAGNGDAHLKNFSLLADSEGRHVLSPAYDQLSTWILGLENNLALPVGGKHSALTKRNWMQFAGYCDLPERSAISVSSRPSALLNKARTLIEASPIPDELAASYKGLLTSQAEAFS